MIILTKKHKHYKSSKNKLNNLKTNFTNNVFTMFAIYTKTHKKQTLINTCYCEHFRTNLFSFLFTIFPLLFGCSDVKQVTSKPSMELPLSWKAMTLLGLLCSSVPCTIRKRDFSWGSPSIISWDLKNQWRLCSLEKKLFLNSYFSFLNYLGLTLP